MTVMHSEVAAADLRKNASSVLGRARYGHERMIVTLRGKPAAAIISAEELEYFERLEDAADAETLRLARESDDGYRIDAADVIARLGL